MLISNSLQEHAIKVPPIRYESADTLTIGDIEIVNWQRTKSLEEIEAELPDSFEQKLASKYVRSVLREKIYQRPDLDKLRENILHRLSKHEDIIKRDKQKEALDEFEKKYFRSLVERIIGGCVVQAPFLPAIQKAKEFAKELYTQWNVKDVQVGTMISFIQSSCKSNLFNGMSSLSHNTLRKIIQPYAPKSAFRKGRSSPSNIAALELEAKRLFGTEAFLF
ncbi:hypothetical protein [Vibrio sp. 16]|uniref:hypothetical protein n=1 Tax=Vibrio sp. 16 TaxID=391586 RepID=UPI00018F3DA8|nr:hypothetical protein [Vibrio sp. 16]EED27557.1 hypothetical protein VPMS16_3924 [Vibrio sp. 16]CAK4070601.1 hypothetical protein VDT1_2552 [Vibrio sp. 16]HCE1504456.1 hypothetical protein [Vibrio parahaemolyticus]